MASLRVGDGLTRAPWIRLGQHQQARAVRARLRALFDQPHWAKDADALDLMHEAEALIAPPRATTER